MILLSKFNRIESKFYLLIWISAVLYAIWKFSRASQKYFSETQHREFEDFTMGWSFLNTRLIDITDLEWLTLDYYFNVIYPIVISYLIIAETIRYLLNDHLKLLMFFQAVSPIIYMPYALGYKFTIGVLFQPLIFYILAIFKSKKLIWVSNLVCLALIASYKKMIVHDQALQELGLNEKQALISIWLLCWMNLKCTSFYLSEACTSCSILEYTTYCFYCPTLFTGPFIHYEQFKKMHDSKSFETLENRLLKLGFNMIRCLFWMLFTNFCLHFIYVNATSVHLDLVKSLDFCSLCGYGYLMGQFFHLKYLFIYGLSTSIASFENITVPRLPRCIGRVHLYSDMWKYFDAGLYNFLKRHIFIPSQELGLPKFFSSFLCFFFVYIWHGLDTYILIWATTNFMGVCLERVINSIHYRMTQSWPFIKTNESNNMRRLKCALASPLLAISAISNFYFFAGQDVGDVFVEKSINEPYWNKAIVLLVLYCCCEVSTEVRDVEAHQM